MLKFNFGTGLLYPPIRNWLNSFYIAPSFKETITGFGFINKAVSAYAPFSPFTHSSIFLLASAIGGFIFYRHKKYINEKQFFRLLSKTLKRTILPSITILLLTIMSKIMSGTGQVEVLATGVSNAIGISYILFASTIGLVGSFITSSNMSSNLLFGHFQVTVGQLLDISVPMILAAQTAGAAIGTSIAPSNMTLGCMTAGIIGKEGEILRKLLPISIGLSILFGIICLIFNSILV